jgi:hypothetical protein
MGGGLVYGLMAISAFGSSYFLLLAVCILLARGRECFQDVVSSQRRCIIDVMTLKFNKASLSRKDLENLQDMYQKRH